jgi:6-pyruvoyltetrahydropterin/6-carboxytetrahydropterin synthase
MQKSLLQRIAPRLKDLDKGGYARIYRKNGKVYRTSLHLAVSEILDAIGADYEKDVVIPGLDVKVDFAVNGTFLIVDRLINDRDLRQIESWKKSMTKTKKTEPRIVLIARGAQRSDDFDEGIRVVDMGSPVSGDDQTIFLDDPTFNFDYAHILPHTQKCSVMHGHTSSALIEIVGHPIDGMVVDFGIAKDIIRAAVRDLDHKLFIDDKYVTASDGKSVTLNFKTVHGDFNIRAPRSTTVLLDGEATVENLANELLSRITSQMPSNVSAVGVYVYEGLNKGTHLLAQVHSREVEKSRKKQ